MMCGLLSRAGFTTVKMKTGIKTAAIETTKFTSTSQGVVRHLVEEPANERVLVAIKPAIKKGAASPITGMRKTTETLEIAPSAATRERNRKLEGLRLHARGRRVSGRVNGKVEEI